MQQILEMLKNEYFLLVLLIINILLIIIFIINTISSNKVKKSYKLLIKKLSRGSNIEDNLKKYLETVENIQEENTQVKNYCRNIENELNKCIKKVGMVRYSAFKDMGSDLSFALALLDDNNNGVILNGIYSVENSNIYAKLVENGKSKYSISNEEQQALDKAMGKF